MSSRTRALILLVVAVAGVAVIITATWSYGPGQPRDSAWYISAARGLCSGDGFVKYDGEPFSDYPPLLPALLAAFGFLGVEPAVTARFANAVFYAAAVTIAAGWVLREMKSSALAVTGLVAVFLAIPLLRVSVQVVSEPLFVVCVLLCLVSMGRYLRDGGARWIGLSAAFASLACLTRYAGLPLVLSSGLVLLAGGRGSLTRRIRQAIAFVFISCVPTGLWLVRNHVVTGQLTGPRPAAVRDLATNLELTVETVSAWVLPRPLAPTWRFALLGVAAVFLAVALVTLVRRRRHTLASVMPMLAFAVVYPASLLISARVVRFAPPSPRIYSPLYLPLVLLALAVADGTCQLPARAWMRKGVAAVLTVLLALWLVYPAARAVYFVRGYLRDGAGGFTNRKWLNSGLVQAVRRSAREDAPHSNEPEALYLWLGRRARLAPRRVAATSPGRPNELEAFQGLVVREGGGTLLWLADRPGREYCYTPEEIARVVRLAPVASFPEGTVYRMAVDEETRVKPEPASATHKLFSLTNAITSSRSAVASPTHVSAAP